MESFRVEELDERVEFFRLQRTQQPDLSFEDQMISLGTQWAKVRPMSGREQSYAQQTQSRANYLVVIRYRGDLLEKDICRWRGHDMNIRFIRDGGPQREFLPIECERGAPQ